MTKKKLHLHKTGTTAQLSSSATATTRKTATPRRHKAGHKIATRPATAKVEEKQELEPETEQDEEVDVIPVEEIRVKRVSLKEPAEIIIEKPVEEEKEEEVELETKPKKVVHWRRGFRRGHRKTPPKTKGERINVRQRKLPMAYESDLDSTDIVDSSSSGCSDYEVEEDATKCELGIMLNTMGRHIGMPDPIGIATGAKIYGWPYTNPPRLPKVFPPEVSPEVPPKEQKPKSAEPDTSIKSVKPHEYNALNEETSNRLRDAREELLAERDLPKKRVTKDDGVSLPPEFAPGSETFVFRAYPGDTNIRDALPAKGESVAAPPLKPEPEKRVPFQFNPFPVKKTPEEVLLAKNVRIADVLADLKLPRLRTGIMHFSRTIRYQSIKRRAALRKAGIRLKGTNFDYVAKLDYLYQGKKDYWDKFATGTGRDVFEHQVAALFKRPERVIMDNMCYVKVLGGAEFRFKAVMDVGGGRLAVKEDTKHRHHKQNFMLTPEQQFFGTVDGSHDKQQVKLMIYAMLWGMVDSITTIAAYAEYTESLKATKISEKPSQKLEALKRRARKSGARRRSTTWTKKHSRK